MIDCTLREQTEFCNTLPDWNPDKKKRGRYHGSNFYGIPGFGKKKWMVAVQIECDYQKHLANGDDEIDIFHRCIEFLNKPPDRKKYQKKVKNSLYGTLEPYDARFKEDSRGQYIEALVLTDQAGNKCFWGKGQKFTDLKRKRGKKNV
tara:strand:+ start:10515 stop:10955 length:441 start_codon:yes stop_codon:yes gene_type:complete